jgi:hypothetical protein
MTHLTDRVFELAEEQIELMDSQIPDGQYAACFQGDSLACVSNTKWCAGFFPGTAWLTFEKTGNPAIGEIATRRTEALEFLKTRTDTHDLGFEMMCSFGNGLRVDGNEHYAEVLDTAAHSLIKRFSPTVGAIKSWETRWNNYHFPVIIDNMMNLELLLKVWEMTGDEQLKGIAVTHANTTLANHFRTDNSSFHAVDYNPADGSVLARVTHQGYADNSAWARGQAWGVYGYTVMYRFTRDQAYLAQAEKIADYILGRLPKDSIPYWDFDDPAIPDAPRDASAAAITASALIELYSYLPARGYRKSAEKILRTLAGPEYLSKPGANGGFILMHSTGNKPKDVEIDVPLSYADYYFLEALSRFTSSCR